MAHPIYLKKSDCKNCYKCVRHCPVQAIRFSGNLAHVIADECMLCGQCYVVCPQDAQKILSDVERVEMLLDGDAPVYLSADPSFVAYYAGTGIEKFKEAAKALGFVAAEEAAKFGVVVKREYEAVIENERESVVISSCCPSVNLMIQKHYPDLIKHLSDAMSYVQIHSADIKSRDEDAKVVFVGPCIARKDEANRQGSTFDAVLTFEEFDELLRDKQVEMSEGMDECAESKERLFAASGGISKCMKGDDHGYAYLSVDGANKCIDVLEDIKNGEVEKCFIELWACAGGCVGGPSFEKYHNTPVRNYKAVSAYAGDEHFNVEQPELTAITRNFEIMQGMKVMPNEHKIREIMMQMGKSKPGDELNCGMCGYETCREKAIAVYQNKAEIKVCQPLLAKKSENFSDIIFDNTPNGLLVLNERLEIQEINPAACKIMNIRRAQDVLGAQIVTLLEPKPFMDVLQSKKSSFQCAYLAEYDRYVEQSILYDNNYHMLFCLIEDVTDEANERSKKAKIRQQTTAIADQMVEKQMRIVQEIASLLGETTAETKIALTKLKDTMED